MLLALFFVSYYPPILYGQRSAAPSTMEDGSSLDSRRRRSYIKVFPLLMIRRFSSFVADLAVDTGATQHGPLQASPSLLTISVRPAATPGPQLYNTVLYYPTALSYLRLAIRLVGRITDCIFFSFFQNKKTAVQRVKRGRRDGKSLLRLVWRWKRRASRDHRQSFLLSFFFLSCLALLLLLSRHCRSVNYSNTSFTSSLPSLVNYSPQISVSFFFLFLNDRHRRLYTLGPH